MKHRKLRRIGILVLVLVLFFNTLGARASTEEPTVIVDSYGALYTAITDAKSGDVIGVKGIITIPAIVTLDAGFGHITIKRMEPDSKIIISGDYGDENKATLDGFTFDGNATEIGGIEPFIEVAGNAYFKMCDFYDCLNEGKNGGAVYISSGKVEIGGCYFEGNSAYNGSHIYNTGVLNVDNSTFTDGWSDEAGGAIYNAGSTTIDNTEIKENNARIGGGIYNSASLEIINSLVWSNTATIQGADIANEGNLSNTTTEEEYNNWLDYYGLYYAGWYDDTNTSFGGSGDYLKFLTSTEPPAVVDPVEPSDEEPLQPIDPDPTEQETSPNDGDDAGNLDPSTGNNANDNMDPSSEGEQDSSGDNSGENNDGASISTPSEANEAGENTEIVGIDNSIVDNSAVNNSQTNIDNSNYNASHESNDNSSYREDNSYRDSSSTVNNYYQQESLIQESSTASQNGSQPINITVPVEVSASEDKEAPMGSTAAQEREHIATAPQQNIKIEVEGVDLIYEYTESGINISISSPEAPESPTEAIAVNSTTPITETLQEADKSLNWVEFGSLILLAALLGLEVKDRWKNKA